MSGVSVTGRAFIEIPIDHDRWELPQEFAEALRKYIGSIPTPIYLPWPATMLPEKGAKFCFYGLPASVCDYVAGDTGFDYLKEEGVTAYVVMEADWNPELFNLQALYCFAEEGFLLEEQKKPIQEALEEAGLWEKLKEQFDSA